jgi:hypothetical protein
MSRRSVRGETSSRAARSVPGQYRRDWRRDNRRSVRVPGVVIRPVSRHLGQELAANGRRVPKSAQMKGPAHVHHHH